MESRTVQRSSYKTPPPVIEPGHTFESVTSKVKTIARAAAIWRSFESSQDALAENGLKFLRGLLAA